MKITELPTKLIALTAAYVDKTETQPYLGLDLRISADANKPFQIILYYPIITGKETMYFRSGTAEGAIQLCQDHIDVMPDKKTQNRMEFQADLAKLIDKGNDFNLNVNPLQIMSQELAENAIELHR